MKTTILTRLSAFLVILSLSNISALADILNSWHWRNPTPFSDTMQSLCFGAGKFVAVGSGGVIHTSSDGQSWDNGRRPVLFTLNHVIFDNSQFVAVGNHGTIATSTNGLDWTVQASGTTNDLLAITFGDGLYVACGAGGQVATSADGSSWRLSNVGTSDLNWVTFGNGVFILPTPDLATTVLVSPNAVVWASETVPAPINYSHPHHLFQVEFGNGVFLAVVEDEIYENMGYWPVGHLYQSTDGTNWIQGAQGGALPMMDTPSPIYHNFLTFANGSFYESTYASGYAGNQNFVLRAANASSYVTAFAPSNAPEAKYLAYGNGRYVLMEDNGKCWTSTDAANWISSYGGIRTNFYQITAGAGNLVALASGQPILISPDGVHFMPANNSPAANVNGIWQSGLLNAVCFDGTNYVAVGGYASILPNVTTGLVSTSTNSTDWVSRTSNANQPLKAICRGPDRWVAVGNGGTVISSAGTLAWTLRTSGTANDLHSVAFGNGNYVAVGTGGTIISAPDGANWDVQYSGTTSNLNCVGFSGGQFLAVGDGGLILASTNGGTWSSVPSGSTSKLTSIAYGDGRSVICGEGVVLASTNGLDWQDISAKVPVGSGSSSVAFINQSFWITGSNGSILQSDSADGIPRLTGSPLSGNGGFRLTVTLNVPPEYRIQFSTNLATWKDLASFTNAMSPAIWDDSNGFQFPSGFYRIAAP